MKMLSAPIMLFCDRC